MPEISRGTDEFNSGGEFVVVSGLDVDDAAILMLLGAAVDDSKGLPNEYRHTDDHQASVGANALYLGGFAKELSLAFKSEDFDRDEQPEAFASALRARGARRSLRIHTKRG